MGVRDAAVIAVAGYTPMRSDLVTETADVMHPGSTSSPLGVKPLIPVRPPTYPPLQ
jgi:hypothetical protein